MEDNREIAIELTKLVLSDNKVPSWFYMVANDIFYNRLPRKELSLEGLSLARIYSYEAINASKLDVQKGMIAHCTKCGDEVFRSKKIHNPICFICRTKVNRIKARISKRKNKLNLSPV